MNIPQVKLLKGSHSDTGQTGHGCFMNVVAYLNGEPTITDHSECVCFVLRPLAIWVNDWMTDAERPQLLPFILRAMGSRTTDKTEISRRLKLVVAFANEMAKYADDADDDSYASAYAAKYAADAADAYATNVYAAAYADAADAHADAAITTANYAITTANYAAKSAAKSAAEYAAEYAVRREQIISSLLKLFDAALPPLEQVDAKTVQRIRSIEALAA